MVEADIVDEEDEDSTGQRRASDQSDKIEANIM